MSTADDRLAGNGGFNDAPASHPETADCFSKEDSKLDSTSAAYTSNEGTLSN